MTAENHALADIGTMSDHARTLTKEINKRNDNVAHYFLMGRVIEAIKLTIEIEYLSDVLSKLISQLGKRTENTINGSTLENFDFENLKLPNDFWERKDNKNKLEHFTKLSLKSGKLNYQ